MKSKPSTFSPERLLRIGALTLLFTGFAAYIIWGLPDSIRPDFSFLMPIYVGLGVIAGILFFYTLRRPPRIFWMGVAAFAVLLLGLGIGLNRYATVQADARLTCRVCGYKSLATLGDSCGVCQVRLTPEHARIEGFDNVEDLLAAEQIAFFAPVGASDSIDFLGSVPRSTAYTKDTAWRPTVQAAEIHQALHFADSLGKR
jgi:hypothetical protein